MREPKKEGVEAVLDLIHALREATAPMIHPRPYDISIPPYGVEVDVVVSWWDKGKPATFPGHGEPRLSMDLTIDKWAHEEWENDLAAEDEILDTLAKKFRLNRKKLMWVEGRWLRSGSYYTRRVAYSGKIRAKA